VCLVPEFLILKYKVPFYFGGTSPLIIVVVRWTTGAGLRDDAPYESLLKKELQGRHAGPLGLGENHESDGIGEKDLPQMQNRAAQAGRAGDLHGSTPQTASGLIRP
jgi:hypothetical protein